MCWASSPFVRWSSLPHACAGYTATAPRCGGPAAMPLLHGLGRGCPGSSRAVLAPDLAAARESDRGCGKRQAAKGSTPTGVGPALRGPVLAWGHARGRCWGSAPCRDGSQHGARKRLDHGDRRGHRWSRPFPRRLGFRTQSSVSFWGFSRKTDHSKSEVHPSGGDILSRRNQHQLRRIAINCGRLAYPYEES